MVECLEAALWCFHQEGDFDSCALRAANLGGDTDATAAVAGQLAGAFYGLAGIRASWVERLAMREDILALGNRLGLAGAG